MTSYAVFTGFPDEGIQFLHDLRDNNHKDWFDAHKSIYQKSVQAPAVALVATLGEQLHAHFPQITYDTRTNGGGSMMRIYRDTRFSADKTPYKTNVAMMFTADAKGRMEQPGFGLQISGEAVELVAGLFQFSKPALEAYRQAVIDDTQGAALAAAVAQVMSSGEYTLGGETYKRVPTGYDAQHPRAGWLKYSGLHVFAPALPIDVARDATLVDVAVGHFRHMAPIQVWLENTLFEEGVPEI